jgi:benzoyl-CoA reductase/2-hydroxyglutaryl-CoA dehydratase subunit BcrC/BadD/HgdB
MSATPPRRIGITTTVPVEVILASGAVPVDLNNAFIGSADPGGLVDWAESRGFPRACCAWIKGIFAVVGRDRLVEEVVGVVRGDCSATTALLERLSLDGVAVIPFGYPYTRRNDDMCRELERFAARLGVSVRDAERVREELRPLRRSLEELDRMTWEDGVIDGRENHAWLVASSDFGGDPTGFEQELIRFVSEARRRPTLLPAVRLGYVGVPGIVTDLYEVLEEFGARVVFNETQRQFVMTADSASLADQYLAFTYPYDVFCRARDIERETERRRIQGLIHYVQSFCFRQIQDYAIRRSVSVPVLTLEADRPGPLDARARLRLESFVEMLSQRSSR